jgi:hypothetical protein
VSLLWERERERERERGRIEKNGGEGLLAAILVAVGFKGFMTYANLISFFTAR